MPQPKKLKRYIRVDGLGGYDLLRALVHESTPPKATLRPERVQIDSTHEEWIVLLESRDGPWVIEENRDPRCVRARLSTPEDP